MALASVAAFGRGIWLDWVAAIPDLLRSFQANSAALYHLMPTVTASLIEAGLAPSTADLVQGASTLGAIAMLCVLLWRRRWRHGAGGAMDTTALPVAAFLVTPYAFVYDMPMVTASLITTMAERGKPFRLAETAILAAAFFLPLLVMCHAFNGFLAGPLVLWAAFLVIIRTAWFRPEAVPAGQPLHIGDRTCLAPTARPARG